jgi:hypothetical protein
MSDETWLTAAEAVEAGLADEVEEPIQMAACFDLSRYKNVPRALASLSPARATVSTSRRKEKIMNLDELRDKHADLVAQVEAQAREGMIAQAEADTARTEAVAAENTRIMDLVQAAIGEEGAGKIRAAADKGLTAEDLQSLGVNLAPAASGAGDRQAILDALHNAAPTGLHTGNAQTGETAEKQAAVSAIAAGGSVK